jgi:riboflavin synthase
MQHMEALELSNDTMTEVSFPMPDNTMVVQKLQVGTPIEDVVVVEDASDDEEDLVMMAIDSCTSSVAEAKIKETQPIVELPRRSSHFQRTPFTTFLR